ncbi:MAG: NAD(P)-dependent oxidoreductase [Eubacteriales bacterium]|nr:NAD(P)-dependent oxidoreductase [Eubacteriales bacterium]
MKIGFIGTGVMGESMARHLMEKGHQVTVFNRTKEKAEKLLAEGASWAESAGECAKGQDAVITIVGFPKDVEEVYLGQGGVLDCADRGALVVDMTTTSPKLWQSIAAKAREKGLRPLDAPVSGGDSGARNATLSIMVGGAEEDFRLCLPLFECMGTNVVLTGQSGCGQYTKMANQIAIAGTLAGVAEAMSYGEKCGLDLENMLGCISGGAAGSWQMSNNGQKMVLGDEAPGFYIKHFVKDMKIAMEEGESIGCKLPVLAQVLKANLDLMAEGKGELGTQALLEWYREGSLNNR